MFENRRWLILPTNLTSSIDFDQVIEESIDSLVISINGSETFVKYDIEIITSSFENYWFDANDPSIKYSQSVAAGVYGRPTIYDEINVEYTHPEILNILTGSAWAPENPAR